MVVYAVRGSGGGGQGCVCESLVEGCGEGAEGQRILTKFGPISTTNSSNLSRMRPGLEMIGVSNSTSLEGESIGRAMSKLGIYVLILQERIRKTSETISYDEP